jgi:DNA-dependent protein kinase catalytic subunit
LFAGLSHLPAANAGLDALERWLRAGTVNDNVWSLLEEVLPILGQLMVKSKLIVSITGVEEAEAKELEDRAKGATTALASSRPASMLRKSAAKRKKARKYTRIQLYSHTICATIDKRSGVDLDGVTLDGIDSLQHRVVLLLGRLGGRNRGVLGSLESQLKRSQSWNTNPVLMLAYPLANEKVNVFLDTLFPTVAEVALESSNRQTKVVACELLHAMTLHLVGASSSDPGQFGEWWCYHSFESGTSGPRLIFCDVVHMQGFLALMIVAVSLCSYSNACVR